MGEKVEAIGLVSENIYHVGGHNIVRRVMKAHRARNDVACPADSPLQTCIRRFVNTILFVTYTYEKV